LESTSTTRARHHERYRDVDLDRLPTAVVDSMFTALPLTAGTWYHDQWFSENGSANSDI
jgi:hypothetical protein